MIVSNGEICVWGYTKKWFLSKNSEEIQKIICDIYMYIVSSDDDFVKHDNFSQAQTGIWKSNVSETIIIKIMLLIDLVIHDNWLSYTYELNKIVYRQLI